MMTKTNTITIDQPLNLLQRIDKVMRKVEYVKRDTRVQGYSAITHDEVLSAIRAYMVEAGIKVMVTNIEYTHEQIHTIKGEDAKITYSTIANLEMTYFNQDNPTDCIKTYSVGHGIDSLDKSTGKAMTYARKNNYLATFMLETGINDEARRDSSDVYTIDVDEVIELQNLMDTKEYDHEKFMSFFKIKDIYDLSKKRFEQAKAMLQNKPDKVQEND